MNPRKEARAARPATPTTTTDTDPAAAKLQDRRHSTTDTAASLPTAALQLSPCEADSFASVVDGAFVVVVLGPSGRYRRRVFLTVASAQRAVQHATERGQSARVVLAELTPLYDVQVPS